MKFHRLEIHNLNSLYGDDHVIDFDDELQTAPLFLIMGPTGSGKSTLLDAICLALFGNTPRQIEVRNPRDVAEALMSRDRGEASAMLEFSRICPEEGGRVRYRAEWYCNRAHKRADGRMQKPQRSLERFDGEGWETLVTRSKKQKEFEPYFQKARAGMSLDDFLRSILLAQGDFTAFLEADEEVKADILEKLTDTDDYVAIGKRAKQRWRDARNEVEQLESNIEHLELLDDEEFEQLQEETETLKKKVEELSEDHDKLRECLQWRQRLGELEKGVKKAGEELEEIEEKKKQRSDDYQRLKLASAARPIAQVLQRRDELDDELEQLDEQLEKLSETLTEKKKTRADKKSGVDKAKQRLEKAEKQRREADGDLKKARQLRSRLEGAEEQKKKAKTQKKAAAEKVQETTEQLKENRQKVKEAKEAVKAAEEKLDELADHEGIGDVLSGLQARVRSYVGDVEKCEKLTDKNAELTEQRANQRKDRKELAEKIEDKNEQLDQLKEAHSKAKAALSGCLEEAESAADRRAELRKRRDELKDTLAGVDRLTDQVDDFEETWEQRVEGRTDVEKLEQKLTELNQRQQALGEKLEAAEELVEAKTEVVQARRLPLKLVEERRGLEADEPCPVCGSTDHPYRHDPPDEEELEELLEQAKTARIQAAKKRDSLDEEITQVSDNIAKNQGRVETARQAVEKLEARCQEQGDAISKSCKKIGIQWQPEQLDAVRASMKQRGEKLGGDVEDVDEQLAELEKAEQAHRDAREAYSEADSELKSLQQSKQQLDEKLEDLAGRLDSIDADIEQLQADIDAGADELTSDFAAVGIDVDEQTPDGFEKAVNTAEEKKNARGKAQKAVEEAKEKLRDCSTAVDKLEAKLPDQKQRLEQAEESLEKAVDELRKLKGKVENILDGEDPDQVEKRLEEAISDARKSHEQATEQLQEIDAGLSSLNATIEEKKTQRTKNEQKSQKLRKELDEKLAASDFDSEQQLRDAVIDDEAFEKLNRELEKLDEEHQRLETTADNRREELEKHRDEVPEAFDEERTVEQLTQQVDQHGEKLKQHQQTLGARREKIDRQNKQRQKNDELTEKLKDARAKLGLWDEMRMLIGANDGQRFKQFAQALNLENIVYHANQHLRQLNDRYRLAVVRDESGHPRLDFEVVDKYFNDRARRLSTLSGGETFLVSLSLALALADFRQVKMPVETLLLDEGFGTLDQQSLEDAVNALQKLHVRDSRQVGVISHVERLQERIDHRVILEKLGGGRSKIEIDTPGGR